MSYSKLFGMETCKHESMSLTESSERKYVAVCRRCGREGPAKERLEGARHALLSSTPSANQRREDHD